MSELTGHCLCGSVAFRVHMPVRDVHHCHCTMCRHATGSAVATLVWVKQQAVKWTGAPSHYRSSAIATRGFCPGCGTPLFLDYDGSGDIALLIGAFDAPADPSDDRSAESTGASDQCSARIARPFSRVC